MPAPTTPIASAGQPTGARGGRDITPTPPPPGRNSRHGRRAADADVTLWAGLTWGSARFAITAAITMLTLALAPAALGCRAVVVVSGSMQPNVWVGDVLVARPLGHQLPRRGQVLLVDDPSHPGRLISHRLIRLNRDGTLMLKGDDNPAPDSTPIPPSAIHGVAVLRVPLIGHPAIWAAQQQSLPLAASTLLAVSTSWLGLRPPPQGTSRGHTAHRTPRPNLPRARHKKITEPRGLLPVPLR